MNPGPGANIDLDDDEGVAGLSDVSSTSSVRSSILDYPVEHGRQYHAYKNGVYHRPNDDLELDRLDLMHEMCTVVNHGKLHLAPIELTTPRILDIGAGTGIWCMDMGDEYPQAEIIGVDISATVPPFVPPNVIFEIDDVEDSWTYSQSFDYIHSRYMTGSIRNWPKLMGQCFQHLREDGWVEFQDFDVDYYSQDGTLTTDHALRRWLTMGADAAESTGRTLHAGKYLEQWVRDAGFHNINVVRTPIPFGRWPKDKRMKKIGVYNWNQLWEGLDGLSLRLFTGVLGWKRENLEVLLMEVRRDLQTPTIHPIMDLYTVWAQKPKQ